MAINIRRFVAAFFSFAPAIVWGVVIFMFSSQSSLPGLPSTMADFVLKKLAHMMVFGVLYGLLFFGFTRTYSRQTLVRIWWLPLTICLLYAMSDEYHQALVGGSRNPTLRDVGYDMLGASVVFLRSYRYI